MNSRILESVTSTILLVQMISAQCRGNLGNPWPGSLKYAPEITTGGSFSVRSISPIAPTGLAVHSDQLVIEGPLVIDGNLPFLGTVALEGVLPSVGAGNVAHSCGGAIGISSEITPAAAPVLGPYGRPPVGAAGFGPGMLGASPLGLGPRGPGCGRFY